MWTDYIVDNTPVGGSHGGSVIFNQAKFYKGVMLREVGVWKDDGALRGLRLTWTDDTSDLYGKESGDWNHLKFDPGETCTELVLWGNGSGTRTGRIKIVTSNGKTLDWGMHGGSTAYPMTLGSGLLVGFSGASGSDIDRLCGLFLKSVKSITSEAKYGQLPGPTEGIRPKQLEQKEFDNSNGAQDMGWSVGSEIKVEESNTWTQSATLAFGASATVKAGIPEVAQVEASAHWELSGTVSHSSTTTETRTITWGASGVVKPNKCLRVTATYWEGQANIEYTSTVTVVLKDGGSFTYTEPGTLNSIACSSSHISTQDY